MMPVAINCLLTEQIPYMVSGLGNGRRNRKSVLIFGYFPELTITRR
jgi:hypothetical protein